MKPVERICVLCGQKFVQYESMMKPAKKCPTCKDILQKRDTIVVSRKNLVLLPGVEIGSIPHPWSVLRRHRSSDFSSYKIDIRGRDLPGADPGEGRIVLRSRHPFRRGEVVTVRVAKAVHLHRDTGKHSVRRYVSLEKTNPQSHSQECRLQYLTTYCANREIKDASIWSVRAWSMSRKEEEEQTIAILAVVGPQNPIAIMEDNTQMTIA